MNVALHNIKAALINARAQKTQDVDRIRTMLAVAEAERYQLGMLLDDVIAKQEREEKERREKRLVGNDGQDFDKAESAIRDSEVARVAAWIVSDAARKIDSMDGLAEAVKRRDHWK